MSSSLSTSRKIIVLRSSDGVLFEVEEAVALLSETIGDGIKDNWVEGGLPLPTIHSKILSLVIEYCKKHVHDSSSLDPDQELRSWDEDFVKLEKDALFGLIQAANYLNIKGLLDLTCQTVADMIKGMTPGEIKEFFNIKNDLAPEEEEEFVRENQWAFE